MKAYTDGACRGGNPGETSCAFAIFDGNAVFMADSKYLGPELHTNNYAEYQGLLMLLGWAREHGVENLEIFSDSKLVVNQINGTWKVNDPNLAAFAATAYALKVRGGHTLRHIHGHSGDPGNDYADKLCNEVLDHEGK